MIEVTHLLHVPTIKRGMLLFLGVYVSVQTSGAGFTKV